MRIVRTNTKKRIVRIIRLGIVCSLFTSAAALALLAINETVEKAVANEPRKGFGQKTPADPASNTSEVLSYQDSAKAYRYKVIGPTEEPPSGFIQSGFDETDFNTGDAPFGGGGGGAIGGGDCPLRATVQTPWPVETQLLVRRVVSIPAGATSVRVMVSVDNNIAGIFFNGTRIAGFTPHDGCPIEERDEFRFDVPPQLVLPGDNLVAFHLLDQPVAPSLANETFFDTRILAEVPLDQLPGGGDVQQAPLVPVSDVKVLCRVDPNSQRTSTKINYVVAGTGELGGITIEQSAEGALAVENLLNGNRMANGTITSNNTTMSRSDIATQKLANLDAGVLSVGSVLLDQTALAGLFQCIATPVAAEPSCAEKCNIKAAQSTAAARLLEGFTQGGAVTAAATQLKAYSAYASDYLSRAAASRVVPKIELLRLQCLSTCAQCEDGIDNDGDGKIDYPTDKGCSGPTDNDELAQCEDGIDNDKDGKIDYPNDKGCIGPSDDDEFGGLPECFDGVDNDKDGKIDYPADKGCSSEMDDSESPDPFPASFFVNCKLYKTIDPRLNNGDPFFTGPCGVGTQPGNVIGLKNLENLYIVRIPKVGKTVALSDCNNSQAVIDVLPRQSLEGTRLQQVLANPRLPFQGYVCTIPGVLPRSLPDFITVELTAVPP